MNAGVRALLSGFVAFVVATATVALVRGNGRDGPVDALTIGGLTGGAVALSVWATARRQARSDTADAAATITTVRP